MPNTSHNTPTTPSLWNVPGLFRIAEIAAAADAMTRQDPVAAILSAARNQSPVEALLAAQTDMTRDMDKYYAF